MMLESQNSWFPPAYFTTKKNVIWFKGLGDKIKHTISQSNWHTCTVNLLHSEKFLHYSSLRKEKAEQLNRFKG